MNSDKQIAVYDNTISARTYLSYIAEQAGGFACIGRDGKLYIRTIGQNTTEVNVELFQDYTWGEQFKVSRVAYEDGIQDFKFGDELNNTIWINSDNMYIVDEEQIENIYNELENFECYSFEGTTIIDPALDVGDIVVIDGKRVIYQGDMEYLGKFKISISSKIQTKSKEETTTRTPSQKTVNRRVQSLIDQMNGIITQLVQETNVYDSKFTLIEQDVNQISQSVESMTDFTREKTQAENLYIDDIAEGEGYLLSFIVYGNSTYFTTKNIIICVSTKPRGYGEAVYLTTEDGEDLLTEDGQQFIIGSSSYYITTVNISLDDVLRSLNLDGEMYCDTLEILQDGTIQVTRRIGVDSEGSCYLLDNEEIEIIEEKIVLSSLEDGVYYFIEECPNLTYYANYITQNDYSDTFLTKLELGTKIAQNAEAIRVAWNQISQYLQMEGIDGKATLNIYNEDNNMLMSLSQDGQTFYDENGKTLGTIGIVREEKQDILAFSMPVDWENVDTSRSMAWGVIAPNGQFLPIFYLAGYYGAENSEYGGELIVEGKLSVEEINVVKALNLELGIFWSNNKCINPITTDNNEWLTYKAPFGHEFFCGDASVLSMNNSEIYVKKPFFIGGYIGYPMIGINESNKFNCWWDGSNLWFYVDGTLVTSISDKRLKKEIKQIDNKFLNAISEVEIKQFKADNRNGLISFGIMAQELIEVFNKYEINPNDYEILQEMQYSLNDNTKYYTIEYTQFLVLKQLASDKKVKELEEKDRQKDKIIQDLIARIEKLEEEK